MAGIDGFTVPQKDLARLRKKAPIPTEHAEQVAFFQWLGIKHKAVAKVAFAIPNGGNRNSITGARLKTEGVKRGVPDIFIAYPCGGHHGLFVEMKRQTGGVVSEAQNEVMEFFRENGYECRVCRGAGEAMTAVEEYLKQRCKRIL